MKIDFFASDRNVTTGSYRIWVHDLRSTLRELGHDAEIFSDLGNLRKDSVIILSKADYHLSSHSSLKDRCVGGINVARDHTRLPLDFIIVGSPEEKVSLMSACDNVCIVNLYEKMYENQQLKNHTEKETVFIGYHGSYTHLTKLGQGFVQAYRNLSETHKLHFINITNEPEIAKSLLIKYGFKSDEFTCKKWNYETILRDIREIDIGIMPNLIDQGLINPEIARQISMPHGINSTDYVFRFKNKSNPGRAFVFYQLGIPVIADLTPSNMPMLYDEECGYVAQCKESWLHYLRKLTVPSIRNQVASAAHNRFKKLYDPYKDASRLVKTIMEITNE